MKKLFLALFSVFAIHAGAQEIGDFTLSINEQEQYGYIYTENITGIEGEPNPIDFTIFYDKENKFSMVLFYDTDFYGEVNIDFILDAKADTFKSGIAYATNKGNLDITKAIQGAYPLDIISDAKVLFIRVNGVVTGIGIDGLYDALVALKNTIDNLNPNPFGPTNGNPFGPTGNVDDVNSVDTFVNLFDPENINPYDLHAFLRVFIEDAKRFGLDFSYVYDHKVELEFNSQAPGINEDGTTIAYTDTTYNDKRVHIVVNPANWVKADAIKRLAIMYHELGHDILNLEHKDEQGPLMSVYARSNYTIEDLVELRTEMFNDYKNN